MEVPSLSGATVQRLADADASTRTASCDGIGSTAPVQMQPVLISVWLGLAWAKVRRFMGEARAG
jgi:hypothetical protein